MVKYGNYALDKPTVQKLVDRLEELQPKNILEFGSGTSTYFLSQYADEYDAKVTSLENVERWYNETKELCKEFQSLDLRLAPLSNSMYDTILPDGVDFALIDGPPGWSNKQYRGRRSTFPALWNHLADDFEVWLDDANRAHEQGCLRHWKKNFPIQYSLDDLGKGLAVITRV